MKTPHWTSRDLELLPDDGSRYEIIDGELYVSKQPDWQHQLVGFRLGFLLEVYRREDAIKRLATIKVQIDQRFDTLNQQITDAKQDILDLHTKFDEQRKLLLQILARLPETP